MHVCMLHKVVVDEVAVGGVLGAAAAALQVLAVRVLVEAALGHEQRGDGARRQAHGGRARRDAAAPALAARVVQHAHAGARLPNALCAHHTHTPCTPVHPPRGGTGGSGPAPARRHGVYVHTVDRPSHIDFNRNVTIVKYINFHDSIVPSRDKLGLRSNVI